MPIAPIHTEGAFETAIEHSLLTNGGYTMGDRLLRPAMVKVAKA